MPTGQPNTQLAEAMEDAGLSNKALARAVRELAVRRGSPVRCDHTSVCRWLSGMGPREATARLIVEVIGSRLGRALILADVGLSSVERVDPSLGTTYADSPQDAVDTLARLWRADLDGAQPILGALVNDGAWADAALRWLVGPDRDDIRRSDGTRVGISDVIAVRGTMEAFARLDNSYGGGHARRALVQYLQTDLAALLAGRYTEEAGRELHSAAAEATLLAAWMSYDAGLHGLAQRYFIQALRLAQAADDVLLAASILDAMSHQATFLGRSSAAANLARAALTGAKGRGTPTLIAHFHAMEARALAAGGDTSGTHKALSQAVRAFERRRPDDDPEWIGYFDDGELSAEFSHCYRDIGQASQAVTYADRSLAGAGSSPLSDFFVTMVLAVGYLGQGEVEEACRAAQVALDLGVQLKSRRCIEYMRQFRKQLERFGQTAPARALAEYGNQHVLWTRSDQRR